MATTTIRVTTKTRDALQDLARSAGMPMQQVLDRAIEVYRRQRLLAAVNAAYTRLKESAPAWHDLERERTELDGTLADGLEDV